MYSTIYSMQPVAALTTCAGVRCAAAALRFGPGAWGDGPYGPERHTALGTGVHQFCCMNISLPQVISHYLGKLSLSRLPC